MLSNNPGEPPARLETQIALLNKLGVLEKPLKVAEVATFDFLPDEALQDGKGRTDKP